MRDIAPHLRTKDTSSVATGKFIFFLHVPFNICFNVPFPVQYEESMQAKEEFLSEAVVMKKLNHPNILHLFGVTEHGGASCLVLEYLGQGSLDNYLKRFKKV